MPRHTITLDRTRPRHGVSLGEHGERVAARHLRDDGLEVVARNWRLRVGEVRGELDAVALDHVRRQLVVVEVKARRSGALGGPLAAVTPTKQARIRLLTGAFLAAGELPYRRVRFDVVGLLLPPDGDGRLEHVEGAF